MDWKLNPKKKHEPLTDFYKTFKAWVDIINTFGGRAGYHPQLFERNKEELTKELWKAVAALGANKIEQAMWSACEEFEAMLFINILNDKLDGLRMNQHNYDNGVSLLIPPELSK